MSCAATLTPPSLAERFVAIIGLLCRAIGDRAPKDAATRPLILPAWTRLRRLCSRFVALAAAAEAGRLAAPRPRRGGARHPQAVLAPVRMPGGFGWLLELAPHVDTRIARAQVEHWLTDPDVTALLKTAPQAGRILRPLCRMLGIEPPPSLRLPKCPRVRRKPSPAAEAVTAEPAPDAPRSVPSWLRLPPSPPLPGLPPACGNWASLATKPDPSPD